MASAETSVYAALLFLFGLAFGSFLNVVIFRLHDPKSWKKKRSFCPTCGTTLHARHLIPVVSFFLQGRTCAFCRKPISWQYPLVELATGVTFIAFFLVDGWTATLVFHAIMASAAVVLFVYDLRYMLVPDSISLSAAFVAFVGGLVLGLHSLSELLIGGIIGAGFFLLQYALSKGKWIGGGDIRLGLFMGFLLGSPLVVMALGIAYIIGSAVGVALIVVKAKSWKSHIPFGTFLMASTVATLIWSEGLIAFWKTAFTL